MKYEIWGTPLPAVTLTFERGEGVYTQAGGLAWMTDGVEMETNMRGGWGKAFGRLFSGETLFMVNYRSQRDNTQVTFSSSYPGEIRYFEIHPGQEIIAQKGAFLCATPQVTVNTVWKGGLGGLFGGEGFLLQRYSGNGLVFCELDGSVREYDLAPGEVLKVDTGNVAAFEDRVQYSVESIRGFKNVLFGGEGFFLTTLHGPGKVWLQTMTADELASKLIPYIPINSGN